MSRNLQRLYGISSDTWKKICHFYSDECLKCHKKLSHNDLSVDHIKPLSIGGKNHIKNYQPLCLECNRKKGINIIDYRWDKGNCLLEYLNDNYETVSRQLSFSVDTSSANRDNNFIPGFQLGLLTLPPEMPKVFQEKFDREMDSFIQNCNFEYLDERDEHNQLFIYLSIRKVMNISSEWNIWVRQMVNYGINNHCFIFPFFPALEWLLILYDMLETGDYQRIYIQDNFLGDYLVSTNL